jgi:hypothetical protein
MKIERLSVTLASLLLGSFLAGCATSKSGPATASAAAAGQVLDPKRFGINTIVDIHKSQWPVEVTNPYSVAASCNLRVTNIDKASGYDDYYFTVAANSKTRVIVTAHNTVNTSVWMFSAVESK